MTFFNKINPVIKLLVVITLGLYSILLKKYLVGFIFSIFYMIVSLLRGLFKKTIKTIIYFGIPFSVMILLIQGLYNPSNSSVIFTIGKMSFGEEGIQFALALVSSVLTFVLGFQLFIETTKPNEVSASLNKIGVSKELTFIILSSLNIVPQMSRKLEVIKNAQQSRGIEINGPLLTRAKAYIPLITPLILSSLIDSIERGVTLEVRGFSIKDVKKTSYTEIKFTLLDYFIAFLVLLSFVVLCVIFLF